MSNYAQRVPFSAFILLTVISFFTATHAATFDITNRCSYTIWPAATPGGGRRLDPGQTWSLYVNPGTSSAIIWGRTNCNFDASGEGRCGSGDCAGVLECRVTGQPPLTLAEYTLNGGNNLDYYDISVIDGFNIPMAFGSTNGGCTQLRCADAQCPDAYHQPNDVRTNSCPSGTNYRVVFCP
ncbi:hypothetical protein OROHE_002890 [Orobanche hederae]